MKEKEIFKVLVKGAFPQNLAIQVMPEQQFGDMLCTQAMDLVREDNVSRAPEDKMYFEHDALFYQSVWRPEEKKDFLFVHVTTAVEIKASAADLLKDPKIDQYLGATQYFFIAVPEEILEEAVVKIREAPETMPYKGIVNVDTGEIVVMPQRQSLVSRDRLLRLLGAMFMSKKRHPGHDTEGLYQQLPIGISTMPKPRWEIIDDMKVNVQYRETVLSAQFWQYNRKLYLEQDAHCRKQKRLQAQGVTITDHDEII